MAQLDAQHVPVLRTGKGRIPQARKATMLRYREMLRRACLRSYVQDVLRALRSALSNAVREELTSKNPAALVRVSKPRKSRKVKPWSVEEAQQFLASALSADDPLYAASF